MQSVFEKLALSEENSGVFNGEWSRSGGAKIDKISPIDGTKLASVRTASDDDYQTTIARAQEAFDICDFAVGQSRMLYGLTIQSERPSHRLMEQWHPLGLVAVITAFNFPGAVWSWNAAMAAVG